MYKTLMGVVAASLITLMAVAVSAQNVDFETVAPGTTYQSPSQSPGDVVLSQAGINMSVELYEGTFGNAYIATPPDSIAFTGTQTMAMNGLAVKFDFSSLSPITLVSLQFLDNGANKDFTINGLPVQSVPDLGSYVPPAGYNYNASMQPNGTGTLTIDNAGGGAPITSLTIGGQKFAIDNVTVRTSDDPPPPPTARFSYSVKFVCGAYKADERPATVESGHYATEINIHNYQRKNVDIKKSVLILVEQGIVRGREPESVGVRGIDAIALDSNHATMDDCQRIAEITQIDTSNLTIGYLVLNSSQPIAVDAVYTTTGLEPGGAPPSIDVERIEGEKL